MTSTPESGAEPVSDEAVEAELVAQADETVVTEVAAEEAAVADATEPEAEPREPEVEPREPDAELLAAHELALSALHEITKPQTVGPAAGYALEADGVVSLRFENRLAGYPGWYWTVSLARVEGAEPTVLEVELLPGDGALLAPEWVPWATRLAEYHAQQAAAAEAAAEAEGDEDDAEDDESDEDADDLDDADDESEDDGESILHAGDVDGVDIDELDDDYDESDDDESDEEDESEEDDDEDESEDDESDEDSDED
ncbi:DUF3027 domain-containing protein [Microbacterium sp. SORGH_AS_0862]|uniref:DUF3027 domain-containing protein n=1 Tax=Microbacterium sp. SORGH_AS_0862 TaxID=3041789 RepID=UPI00278F80EC|nr:DUF3027 domain-containing protein [Microbacterium sp. SORGH_AS_0862]MDQ1206156.1 hypothetical protein [Microbacterium sp. SORGH_AS_0862]